MGTLPAQHLHGSTAWPHWHSGRDRWDPDFVPVESLPWPHVLIIDDSLDTLTLCGTVLQDEGFNVTLSSCLPAPEIVRKIRPDAVVLDLLYNGRPLGLALLRALRADPDLSRLAVICCTGMPDYRKAGIPADVPVVEKPFDLSTLLEAVRSAVRPAPAAWQSSAADQFHGIPF